MRAYVCATHKSDEPLLSEHIHKGERKPTMEVLFEYRGSRRQLSASSGENLLECVTTELRRVGRSRAQVYTASVDLRTIDNSGEVYLLQKWSPQWGCYLDVNRASDINDGDKLAVVMKPKPPSKVEMYIVASRSYVLSHLKIPFRTHTRTSPSSFCCSAVGATECKMNPKFR